MRHKQAFEASALRAEGRGLERPEPLIPHAPAAVRPKPHFGARGPKKDEVDVTGLRSVDEAVVTLSLVRGQQASRGIRVGVQTGTGATRGGCVTGCAQVA